MTLLATDVVLRLMAIVLYLALLQLGRPYRLAPWEEIGSGAIRTLERDVAHVKGLECYVFVAAVVLSVAWLVLVYRNLAVLGARELRFGWYWAVIGWWIAGVQFVRPVQVVADAWRASDPDLPVEFSSDEWRRHRLPAVARVWAGLYVTAVTFWYVLAIDGIVHPARSPRPLLESRLAPELPRQVLLHALWVACEVAAIVLVARMTSRQAARAARVRTRAMAPQPLAARM